MTVNDFMILTGKARDGVNLKIRKAFWKVKATLSLLLTAEGKHAFQVISDFAQYQISVLARFISE